MNDVFQNTFVKETLLNFNQILKISTIRIWTTYDSTVKQNIAASNLTSKIKAMETITASEATAEAITKASQNIEKTQSANLATSIRLANLEKLLKRQEQYTNELSNHNKRQKTQKNFYGSHQTEPVTSPEKMAPLKNVSKVVDLTQEGRENSTRGTQVSLNHNISRRKRNPRRQQSPRLPTQSKEKTIQWSNPEIRNFNPDSPTLTTPFQQRASPYTTTSLPHHNGNTFFHPSQMPFLLPQVNSFNPQMNSTLHSGFNSQPSNLQGFYQHYNQTFPPSHRPLNKGNPFNNPFENPFNQK
jgi:hypothetical protein